jgi:hypothetical protein
MVRTCGKRALIVLELNLTGTASSAAVIRGQNVDHIMLSHCFVCTVISVISVLTETTETTDNSAGEKIRGSFFLVSCNV